MGWMGSRPYTNGVEGSSGLGGLPVPEGRPLVLHPELWSSDLSIFYRESISLDPKKNDKSLGSEWPKSRFRMSKVSVQNEQSLGSE
jgi:hypothetical protein